MMIALWIGLYLLTGVVLVSWVLYKSNNYIRTWGDLSAATIIVCVFPIAAGVELASRYVGWLNERIDAKDKREGE